jgi:RNA polymerase sigma-70 factor (ECF subfamily)
MRLVAGGKSEALSILYDRYGRLVYSIAYHALNDAHTAEEITQDVFVRVWEKARTYDVDLAKVSTWLITITRNRAIDELRRGQVRPESRSSSWEEVSQNDIPTTIGPEELVAEIIQQRRVRQAVAALPVDQRTALALAYFKGLSHTEIAEALGEPLGTIKTRIRLAMQKLRETLAEQPVPRK